MKEPGFPEQILLWHDDVRPPPAGWTWARTNGEAQEILRTGRVVAISMDHDLGLHEVETPDPEEDPDGYMDAIVRAGRGEETGFDLVEWMLKNGLVPEKVTVHSWNPDGAQRMAARLNYFGHDVMVAPFVPPPWKEDG